MLDVERGQAAPCATVPRISVVVPCYNQAHFLAETLESVLAQTYPAWEVIVVDDGSTDDTAAVVAAFAGRVKYLRRENGGLSAARNTGLAAATGQLLHFLDSDDSIEPDAYERVAQSVRRNPDADCYHLSWRTIDGGGQPLADFRTQALGADALSMLLRGNRFPPCAGMVRRETALRAGLFKVELRSCEDWDFWIRCAAAGARFEPVADAYALYRRYPGSMSTNHPRMWRSGLQVLEDASRLPNLPPGAAALLRQGKRHWRWYCFKRLVEGVRDAPVRTQLHALAAAARLDPGILVPLTRFAAGKVGRSLSLGRVLHGRWRVHERADPQSCSCSRR